MSAYFESGYIDANYFEGDGVTQSATATLTAEFSHSATTSVTKSINSEFTVTATHTTNVERIRSVSVSINDVFAVTVSVTVSKNHTSALDSNFSLTVTVSRTVANQSTLNNIVTLSLQGDRQRDLASTTLSLEFTQSTQIDKILTAQSTQNTAFTLTATITKLLNAQSDLSSAFTVTTQVDKLLNAQSNLSTAVTLTTQANKSLNAQSDQNSSFSITATVSKIIQIQVDLSAVCVSTLSINVSKNHTAALQSNSTLSCEISKISTINANANVECASTATILRIRNGVATQTADCNLTVEIQRIVNVLTDATASVTLTVTVSKIIQVQADLSGVLASTLTVDFIRNHTATLNSAFTVVVTADKIGSNIIAVSSAFGITVMGDRIRLFTVTIESTHSLNGVITRIRPLDSALNSESAVQVSVNRIQQFTVVLSAVFTPTLNIIILRNHTASISSAFGIECTVSVSRTVAVTLSSDCTMICASERIRYININNIESNSAQSATVNKIAVVVSSQSSAFNLNASFVRIKQFNIVLDSVMTAVLTVSVNRSNNIVLNSQFAIATQISKITGYQSNINSEATVAITATRLRLLNQNIGAEFTVSTQATRIKSLQADLTGAFNSILTITLSRDNSIALTVASTLSCESKRIRITAVTLSSALTLTVTAVETDSFGATFNSTTTLSVTAQKIKLATVTINAIAQLGRLDDARTAKTITTVGDAKISTDQSKFGGSSVVFDGSGDKLTLSSNSDFAMGTGDFSIEFFVYITSTGTLRRLFDFRSSAANEITPEINLSTTNQIIYRVDGTNRIGGALTVLAQNQWHHIAVARVGGSTRMYINGAAALAVYSDSNDYVQGGISIGGVAGDTGTFAGYLDEIRIIKGTSPYTGGSLTVPTESFKNYSFADTKLLIHADGANNSVNITDDVQGFVENALLNRIAGVSSVIGGVFSATINTILFKIINAQLNANFAVVVSANKLKLLNQGIGAEFALSVAVSKIKQFNISLEGTFTPVLTVIVFRNHTATLNSAFNLSAQIIVVKLVQIAITTQTTLTVEALLAKTAQANVSSVFSLSLTLINATLAFNANSNLSLTGVFTVTATALKIKRVSANLQSQFSRVTNFGAVIESDVVNTLPPYSQYPLLVRGSVYFDGNDKIELYNMPTIGTGDYTIEMIAHRSSQLHNENPELEDDLFNADLNFAGFGVPQAGPHIYIGDDDEIKAGNTYILNGDQITTGAFKFQTDANLHIALVRNNAQTRLYVNGVQRGDTLADTVPWTSTTWAVGESFLGYIDEFRVSTIARYTGGNFGDIYNAGTTPFEFRKDSDTAVLLHFNNSLDEGIAQPEKTVDANASLNTTFTVTAVISNTRGVDIVAFANSVLSVDTSNVIDYALNVTVTAQCNITVKISRDFASALFSDTVMAVSVEKLKIVDSAVVAQFNFAVNFVRFKNVQLDATAECTAVIVVNVIRNNSVTVSDQFALSVSASRIRFGVINLQSQFVTTVEGTETEGFAEPVTMNVISSLTVNVESLRIIAVNVQLVSTAVVNVSVLRNASATMLMNAGQLSAIVVQRFTEISLISAITLDCVITKTTRYNAQLSSAFEQITIIIRQRPGACVMSVFSTVNVTVIKNVSIIKTFNSEFSITAEPQPLDQILVVLNIGVISTVTVSGIIVYIEKYELYVREEQRLLNIVSEERNIYIVEENRVFTITDVEE